MICSHIINSKVGNLKVGNLKVDKNGAGKMIGRKKELAEMEARWNSGRFELGVVYGTRRIGKTTLIKAFMKGKNAFYYQARQTTEAENLKSFTRAFNLFRGRSVQYSYDSFESAFDDLAGYAREKRFVFIIDEIAYLCPRDKSFLSTLQAYVDGPFREADMMVLLSGSSISFMEEILYNGSDPLYKRATFQIKVMKMPFSEALSFLTDLPAEDRLNYLALFGGFPYYLAMIDPACSFDENVSRLLFSQYGTLVDAPDKVLPMGVGEQNMYNAILSAVAMSKRSSKDIADAVGREGNYVAKYLSSLVSMQVLEKRESFNRNRKLNYYEISDCLLRFWYRFIFQYKEDIQMGAGRAVQQELAPLIRDFLCHAMEEVAIQYMTEKNVSGSLGRMYHPIRNYRVDNSRLGRSIELDGLAEEISRRQSPALLVIECKYRKAPFSLGMLSHLQESVSVLGSYDPIDYWLFSKSGFTEDLKQAAGEHLHLVNYSDMVG